MNRFLHSADLERLWRDVQLLDKRAQRKAARIRVQKAARIWARKAARKEARKQEEVEWVSPVPHGMGPSECLCCDCVLWWQQEEKAAKQRVPWHSHRSAAGRIRVSHRGGGCVHVIRDARELHPRASASTDHCSVCCVLVSV